MASRIVGMISALTIVGVIAAAAVLLMLALDSEEDAGRHSAKVLAESVAGWLQATGAQDLSDSDLESLIRSSAPVPGEENGDTVQFGDLWVFNQQARLAASSADARPITRDEILPARQVLETGAETVIESLADGRYAGTAAIRGPDGEASGAVRIEFTTSQIGTHFELYRTEYLVGVVLILVALVLASWFLALRLARPIGLMVRAARAVGTSRSSSPSAAWTTP